MHYDKLILDDISFKLNKGEIISIVGPSGCGKSTILNLISKIIEPTKGELKVNGKIGYMFQSDNLLEWYNVLDNIKIGLKINKDKNDSLVNRLIIDYGLKDHIDKYPKSLSGGLKQRVALIRTLVVNPDILLLDEPFSALDAQTKQSVAIDVKKIIKEENKSAILVTHDIMEAINFGDRVIVLSKVPAKIKNEYRADKNFYDDIWNDLRNE